MYYLRTHPIVLDSRSPISLRIRLYVLRIRDYPYIPILRMGLEPENSYSREGSGFLRFLRGHLEHCLNLWICDSMMGQTSYSFSEWWLSGDLAHGRILKKIHLHHKSNPRKVYLDFLEKSSHPQYSAQSTGLCAISPCKRCSKSPL